MTIAAIFIIFILIVGLTFKIWKPGIDILHNEEIVLWYTSPNTNKRNFIFLWKN